MDSISGPKLNNRSIRRKIDNVKGMGKYGKRDFDSEVNLSSTESMQD